MAELLLHTKLLDEVDSVADRVAIVYLLVALRDSQSKCYEAIYYYQSLIEGDSSRSNLLQQA